MAKVIIEIFKTSGFRGDYKVFEGSAIKIGRGYQNDLILSDPYVSADHAVLRIGEDGWVLEDLQSENGTSVNGANVGINANVLNSRCSQLQFIE